MTCRYCDSPALYFCQSHRRYLCDNRECAGYHRLAFRPDFCTVVDAPSRMLTGWRMHVISLFAALAVGGLITWFVA